ncbi:3-phosphoshikimate 1-carboxyvinyltransferase [Senegalia massiliensis]|uniref:3-phosphoshikimate 1-carboxyvinyltransferase n=1 Tax=Senegalia massiliensis TaxID=1720316 RepID=UPI00103122F1|nr:3-phosphoshikimate 1-carboxyvinyltransferase [Senegalia massiliensis]
MNIQGGNITLKGEIIAPGDKSISHRAIMLGAISEGETIIHNFLFSEDCINTINIFKDMGVNIKVDNKIIKVRGVGLNGLKKPTKDLYVGNSGTTIRLVSGILSGQKFPTKISGDNSIERRPMKRIIEPLSMIGANIKSTDGNYPPLNILPSNELNGIKYKQNISSAQVKSSIMFLSLYAKGITKIIEPYRSRDHTERMMKYFGVDIVQKDNIISINSKIKPLAKEVIIPGDISSVSFFIVGALILKDSHIIIRNVGYNITRRGIIDVLNAMGANIKIFNCRNENNEEIVDMEVKYSKLNGIEIKGDIIPRLIDEIPIIAVAASCAEGKTVIKNASELKVKESNRIFSTVQNLSSMGINIEETDDGMIINGSNNFLAANVKSYSDHRIVMSMIIAVLKAKGTSNIDNINSIKTSYPDFFKTLNKLIDFNEFK